LADVKYEFYIWLMPANLNFKDRIKTWIAKKNFWHKVKYNLNVCSATHGEGGGIKTVSCSLQQRAFSFWAAIVSYLDISKLDYI
jgi:hypothetical protein